MLENQDMANIMTHHANGKFTVTVENLPDKPDIQKLYELSLSDNIYAACLKVSNGIGGDHFVALSSIEFILNFDGKPIGIKNINVANPWDSDGNLGKTSYSYNEIKRWDIFNISLNNFVPKNYFYEAQPNYNKPQALPWHSAVNFNEYFPR